jgi:hypothetical protein
MEKLKVFEADGEAVWTITKVGDFEYVNPIEKLQQIVIAASMDMDRSHLSLLLKSKPFLTDGIDNPNAIIEKVIFKNAISLWTKEFKKLISQRVPDKLLGLLENTTKREQIKLLKGLEINGDELMAFIFKAWQDHGFVYSTYLSEHNHSGLVDNKMPIIGYKKEDGTIVKVGSTSLTDGQIKQAIDYKKTIVSKFLDRGEIWHCFFLSFKSLKGQESWNDGQPHWHYISSAWGLSREYVLEQLKSKEYKLPSMPHIGFTDRNPTQNSNNKKCHT